MGRFVPLAGITIVAALVAACGAATAQVVMPDTVPLAMPVAPPHVVVPATPEPPAIPSVETPTTQTTLPVAPGNASRTRTDPPPKPAAPPTPPPATPPAPAPAPPTPLEATPNQGELELRARALKDSAEKALEKIDPKTLGTDARAQYDTAKRFLKQADEALKAKNIVYAWQLADKANTIATLLK